MKIEFDVYTPDKHYWYYFKLNANGKRTNPRVDGWQLKITDGEFWNKWAPFTIQTIIGECKQNLVKTASIANAPGAYNY